MLLKAYCAGYKVDLAEANSSLESYRSLAEFFTRHIKPELRPIGQGKLFSPVDGVLRSFGQIQDGLILDIKGQSYSVEELLADKTWAQSFAKGFFLNFYLSPCDCHHVYAPLQGKVTRVSKITGAFWPVNDLGLKFIPKLFVKNERVALGIDSELGQIALVMVGALNVGKLQVHAKQGVGISKGDKVGTFELGSSVVLLSVQALGLRPGIGPQHAIKFGEPLVE